MKKTLRVVRNIAISIAALLVIVVGGGVAYTWYAGQNSEGNPNAFAEPVEAPRQKKMTPPKVDPTARVSASIQVFTTPITPGSNASISVKTNPLATCLITVEYNKVPSKDSGLIQKKADEFGIVEWAWTVEPTAPLGTWPVNVTCANQKNSAFVRGDLEVVKTLEN